MKRVQRVLFILGFIIFAWAGVKSAQAHALLLRSIPAANSLLDVAPTNIEFFFSEKVSPRLIKINIKGSDGRNMRLSDTTLDPRDATHLISPLPSLSDGVYLVVWQVLSASDGHLSDGSFPFAVGEVDPSSISNASTIVSGETRTPVPEMLVQGILYLSIAAITGGLLFLIFVWDPRSKAQNLPMDIRGAVERSARKFLLSAVVVFVVANILKLLVQTGQSRGILMGWPWQPEFLDLLLGTRGAILTITRLGLAFVILELVRGKSNRENKLAALILSLGLMLTFSLESHAMADAKPFLPVFADWLHFTAVSIWVGGLFAFFLTMRQVRRLDGVLRTQMTAILISQFTILAMTSVAVLTITGVYASILRVGSISALLNTAYGKALILKLVIAAVMLALGAINFLYTSPNMRNAAQQTGGNPGLVRRFNYLLAVEVILGAGLLIWVGVFTGLPTASSAIQAAVFQKTVRADDLQVKLRIDPSQPGLNTFLVTLRADGKAVSDAKDVSLEFTSLTGKVPASKAAMDNLGNGEYRLDGGFLAIADLWDIKVVVIRKNKFDAYADFKLDWSAK